MEIHDVMLRDLFLKILLVPMSEHTPCKLYLEKQIPKYDDKAKNPAKMS